MDFAYTPEVEALRARVRAFMDDHVVPQVGAWQREVEAGAWPPSMIEPLKARARAEAPEAVIEDALAVASLMAMTNVYYRFRHLVGKPAYSEKPARLRMNRIARPSTSKADFELVCLALSALNGCEACIRAHETAVLAGGLTEDHVHDAVRIAAVVNAAAVALEVSAVAQPAAAAV